MPTYGRDGCHNLSKLEFVEDCGLSSSVQPNHQDSHLLLAEEPFEEGGKEVAHLRLLSFTVFHRLSVPLSMCKLWNITIELLAHMQQCVSTYITHLRLLVNPLPPAPHLAGLCIQHILRYQHNCFDQIPLLVIHFGTSEHRNRDHTHT